MANDPRKNKYALNRNLWRRVYSFRRRKPNVRQFIDPATETSFSYDLNKIVRHRDFFIVKKIGSASFPQAAVAEYDEGLISFNNTSIETTSFNFCFSNTPDAVVLSVEDTADNTDNIIAYGLSFTSCSMSIGLSAPFSGNVRYRAAFSQLGYPASATSSLAPASGTFEIVAGHITASNAVTFSVQHSIGVAGPKEVRLTPWDFFANFDVDVALFNKQVSAASSSGVISAPLNNPIYFIASK